MPTDELLRNMTALVDPEFEAVKMKIGRSEPCEDYARVQVVRHVLPDSIHLMGDANTV